MTFSCLSTTVIIIIAPSVCWKVPAFERIPDHVLVGYSQIIVPDINEYEKCLSECLTSRELYNLTCLSAMYSYDLKECAINFDSDLNRGGKVYLTGNTTGLRIDYFENLCAESVISGTPLNSCDQRESGTYIQYEGIRLADYTLQTYADIPLLQCLHICETTLEFACASVAYEYETSMCFLSYQSTKTSPIIDTPGIGYFERTCVPKSQFICGGMGVSFVAHHARKMPRGVVEKPLLKVSGVSDNECLSLCLQDPSNLCKAVDYSKRNGTCYLYSAQHFLEIGGELTIDTSFTHFVSQCARNDTFLFAKKLTRDASFSTVKNTRLLSSGGNFKSDQKDIAPVIQTECGYGYIKVHLSSRIPFKGYLFARNKFDTCRVDIENRRQATLYMSLLEVSENDKNSGRCGLKLISLEMVELLDGDLFNYFQYFTKSIFSKFNPQKPYHYSAILVLSMNEMHIPGLLMQGDPFYNITCDYTAFKQRHRVSVKSELGNLRHVENSPHMAHLSPEGRISIPPPMQIRLRKMPKSGIDPKYLQRDQNFPDTSTKSEKNSVKNVRGQYSVNTVQLGEDIEMMLEYMPEFYSSKLGVFVRQCNATRTSGTGPSPAPLILIDNGCATESVMDTIITTPIVPMNSPISQKLHQTVDHPVPLGYKVGMRAFKFDGGQSVRITCVLDLCNGACRPRMCNFNNRRTQSFGRKKRDIENVTKESGNNTVLKTLGTIEQMPSLIFTVVEKNYGAAEDKDTEVEPGKDKKSKKFAFVSVSHDQIRQICMKSAAFVTFFITLGVICVGQFAIIVIYYTRKWLKIPKIAHTKFS